MHCGLFETARAFSDMLINVTNENEITNQQPLSSRDTNLTGLTYNANKAVEMRQSCESMTKFLINWRYKKGAIEEEIKVVIKSDAAFITMIVY